MVAIEIETGKSNAIENILKNLNHGFSKIIMMPLSAKTKSEIPIKVKELPVCDSHKVEFLNLRDLFKAFSEKI